MVETEGCRMAFTPNAGPVYGGSTIVVALDDDTTFPPDAELFLVYEGSRQRHVTTTRQVNKHTLHATIPGHDIAEEVHLNVYQVHEGSIQSLGASVFHYHYDTAYYMALFLVESVYNVHALDDLELIRSDQFDLANEVVSTLDERLNQALRHIPLPLSWNILGCDSDQGFEERETLLHFAARLGLYQVALFLLDKPGSDDILRLQNRQRQLPCQVASDNGFDDLAELLSGYNIHGMVTVNSQHLERENGILSHHSNGSTSLTTFLNSPPHTTVEEDIDMLQEGQAMMKRGANSVCQRSFESDWPQQCNDKPKEPSLPCETVMEQTIDRIFQDRQAHHRYVESVVGTPVYKSEFIDDRNDDFDDNDGIARSVTSSLIRDGSASDISEEVLADGGQWKVMEGSLNTIREIGDGLQRQRDARILLTQDVRREHLARYSSSCPALDIHGRSSPLSPIDEADHHRSMLDLAEEVGHTSESDTTTFAQDPFLHHPISTDTDVLGERNIRICINGVTVDSSADFPENVYMRQQYSRALNYSDDGGMGSPTKRRRSWCPEAVNDTRNPQQMARARMLALTGKSMSLNSLDGEGESDPDEEEDFQDARDNTPGQSLRIVSTCAEGRKLNSSFHDDRSLSPVDSVGSSPTARAMPDASEYMTRTLSEPTSTGNSARSLSDLPFEMENEAEERTRETKTRTYSVAKTQGVCSYDEEDSRSLGVPHCSMTKSLSTPSIPAATEAVSGSESRKLSLRRDGRKDGKQPSGPSYILIQKLIEEHDAQFRRQDEIEEEEDENVPTSGKRGGEISLQDFLTESTSFESDDSTRSKSIRKEEERKKRKPSVFSRFQNSYRTKKNKEKENKFRSTHQFVSVSISNQSVCHVCHKPMANKPALQCENCLISVHEHNCKDQVAPCDKFRNPNITRVPNREGYVSTSALQERQTASVSGSSLRPSHSFKDKRSSSAPVKSQALQTASQFLPHRNSLPTTRAINEECEVDSVGSGLDIGHSNITETISESLESLEATPAPVEVSIFDDEPDLMLEVEEPETWSITAERKTLKKMGTKDIKRQDTIWELIQTEKEYCRTLKIMQKMFSQGMLQELHYTQEQVERLFPRMDDLVEIHTTFLRQLLELQSRRQDRSIHEVGRTLLNQFEGESADQMKAVYGVFCSKHKEAVHYYKEFLKTDRKFQSFMKSCTNHSYCKRREIPDFILGITVRLSKYPILIEAICKSTKDKKDRDLLSRALHYSKEVLTDVNERVACYERLVEIQSRIDSKATTVFKGKKFKRQDLTSNGRQLLHTGMIGWKNARGRRAEVLAVVLTDLIFFVQDNNGKYSFFVQDSKSCVVPLFKLLVREKRDARDSHGIYLISQNKQLPEMYELVCQSKEDKELWMKLLQRAVETCPEEDEGMPTESEEEKRKVEEKAAKAKEIIDQLHRKDQEIKQCCDEKNRLMMELLDLYKGSDDSHSRPSSLHEETMGSESLEVLQAAMHEASHLATILQGSGTHLSRSVSSAGERVSSSFVAMPVPKRAETFAGFDSSHDVPKGVLQKRFMPQIQGDDGRSSSLLSLDKQESEPQTTDAQEASTVIREQSSFDHQRLGVTPQPQSPIQRSFPHIWEEHESKGYDRSSDKGSLGELSASSVSSLAPPHQEQMMSIAQLVKYLHSLMNLTAQQGTAVESLRAQLAEANEKINKLSADMKTGYRHNQLEELRNLQENISREKTEWEREKAKERALLEKEREHLEDQKNVLEKQEAEIRAKKDELQRQREALQRQIDMLHEQCPSSLASVSSECTTPEPLISVSSQVKHETDDDSSHDVSHRRSASAEFYKSPTGDLETHQHHRESSQPADFSSGPRQTRHSVGNLHSFGAPGIKQNFPVHLLSARNEQKMGGSKVQQLPMKLSLSGNSAAPVGSLQQIPLKISSSSSTIPTSNKSTSSQNVPSGSSQPHQGPRRNSPSLSAPSNLSQVMKLAEPSAGGKRKSPSQAASSHAAPTPNPQNNPPGAPAPKPGRPDDVIYF